MIKKNRFGFLQQILLVAVLTPMMMLLLVPVVAAQNLVPNPSFEIMLTCPTGVSQISLATPWTPGNMFPPDYFHSCTSSSAVSVPANSFGNEAARTGQAYAGFYARLPTYREYVQVPLTSPLVAGVTYQISFYLSLSDVSGWAIDKVGAYLSAGPAPPSPSYFIGVTPQVVNPTGSHISAKNGWTLISGTYVALGGEDHLTIGNFADDLSTPPLTLPVGNNFSYYYIDDVSVANLSNGTSGIIISEFRFDGPNGPADEFVELVNNSSSLKTIESTDAGGTKGWSVWGLVANTAVKICTIPRGTTLAPGQHFLCAKLSDFGLAGYSQGTDNNQLGYPAVGLDTDGGVALFSSETMMVKNDGTWVSTSTPGDPVFREDAVGFRKLNSAASDNVFAPAFREPYALAPAPPTGLSPIGPQVRQYSFVRKHVTNTNGAWAGAVYQDKNDNIGDFVLVSNLGDLIVDQALVENTATNTLFPGIAFDPSTPGFPEASTTPTFGAPGPQSMASPMERNYNTQFIRSLFDTGSKFNVSPNIERNSQIVCGGPLGDLTLRFTYKNNTSLAQTNLRIRWIDLSTINRNNPLALNAVIELLDSLNSPVGPTRRLFVNIGKDTDAFTFPAVAATAQNDPTPSGDGITNANAASRHSGVKTVRHTYVEGVNPSLIYSVLPPLADIHFGSPCRVGGFNSASVARPPTPLGPPSVTTAALPAPVVPGGSISLEHRFGVIKQGKFLLVGIIESN
jgi:hypothetical protein